VITRNVRARQFPNDDAALAIHRLCAPPTNHIVAAPQDVADAVLMKNQLSSSIALVITSIFGVLFLVSLCFQ
jgi:hypothetical protein